MTGLFATQSDLVAAYARAPDVADYGAFMGVSSTILLFFSSVSEGGR
jgi:hypothetical protein